MSLNRSQLLIVVSLGIVGAIAFFFAGAKQYFIEKWLLRKDIVTRIS